MPSSAPSSACRSFLADNGIDHEHYREVVLAQYQKKFGRFGEAVVASNMTVMKEGFSQVREIVYGAADAPDRSTMRGQLLVDCVDGGCATSAPPAGQGERVRLFTLDAFDGEFRAGLGYDQPASAFASVGVMAAATGATATQVRRPPRDADLDSRELHAVHGVHRRLPGHGPAQHGPGPGHGAAHGHRRTT